MLDAARGALAKFVGAESRDLAFVSNATAGVNTVLRSLHFEAGAELLVTDHEYNACRNALDFAAERQGAIVVVVRVPFPVGSPQEVTTAILDRVNARTRLVLADHVTSQTGLVLPIQQLAKALSDRGVDLLVDGAHAPGMLTLDLRAIGAAYYTGNCHKWICAPKSAGFLFVRPDRQEAIRPLSISHGANSPRTDRSKFLIEFGWTGTWDPTAALATPEALQFMGSLLPGDWPAVMARNRSLALAGRDAICRRLGVEPPCPDEMIGALAAIPLADGAERATAPSPLYADPLQDALLERFAIEVPVIPWPAPPKRILRISAQLYNSLPEYERLGDALVALGSGGAI